VEKGKKLRWLRWFGWKKPWKLRWNGCRVANKQTNLNDQELLRANVLNEFSIANVLEIKLKCLKNGFAKNTLKTLNQIAMLNFPTEMKLIPVVPLQTNPLVFSNCKEIRFPVCELARRS
jgi:hypothetical protein